MGLATWVRVSANMEYEQAEALKAIAASEGRTLASLVRHTLVALIHEREDEK